MFAGGFGTRELGKPEKVDAGRRSVEQRSRHAAIRSGRRLTVPADPQSAGARASQYHNDVLGDIVVSKAASCGVTFDFGEWTTPVASRRNPDGTTSFITTVPGMDGPEFVVGATAPKRTLVLRDAQREHVFTER